MKRLREHGDRMARVSAALDRIAAHIEMGELLLATDQPAFFEAVADMLDQRGSQPSTEAGS